jgi:hypothetical protein
MTTKLTTPDRPRPCWFIFIVAWLVMTGAMASAQEFGIDWWSLDGGGGTSTGGTYTVSGIIGQSGIRGMSGGTFVLSGGISGGGAFAPVALVTNATPAALTVDKLQAKVNFNPAKKNEDTCSLTAMPALQSGFGVANQTVTVNVGDAEASFTLNAKGSSKSATNSCKFSYAKKTKVWTLMASMKKGSWATPWAEYGVTNATTAKAGVTVKMPVTVTIGTNTFATDESLLYKATAGKSGTLK